MVVKLLTSFCLFAAWTLPAGFSRLTTASRSQRKSTEKAQKIIFISLKKLNQAKVGKYYLDSIVDDTFNSNENTARHRCWYVSLHSGKELT